MLRSSNLRSKLFAFIAAMALAVGVLVGFGTASAGAANLVRSGRYQFYGPNNEFWDIPWAQYDDGIVNWQIDLYSNSPRALQGTVATFHARDYVVLPNFMLYQGGPGQPSYFEACPNTAADEWPFYSWQYVYPYQGGNYSIDMTAYIGWNSGWWDVYHGVDYVTGGEGSWWIGDSRVTVAGDGNCIRYTLA